VQNVIYFPYIRVPESEWFTRVLLYWKQVASIVPYEYIKSSKLSKFMDALISEAAGYAVVVGRQFTGH
jgi:hypothetical protein